MPEQLEMAEQDDMDRLLFQALSTPPPTLSSDFDRRLARQLQRPRLNRHGRFTLAAYAVLATVASLWTLHAASIPWGMAAVSTVLPLVIVAIMFRRYVRVSAFE